MVKEHIYVTYDGVDYFDYTLYTNDTYTYPSALFGVSANIYESLVNLDRFVDNTIKPPKSSEIYVFPNCPIAADDIRKNYTIKRNFDAGDYNVIVPINNVTGSHGWYIIDSYATLLIPSRKAIIIISDYSTNVAQDYLTFASRFLSGLKEEDIIVVDEKKWRYTYLLGEQYLKYKALLDGAYSKPCVSYEQLDLNTENELNLDVLRLVYETGNRSIHDTDARKNFEIQLNVLNQHNWREYPGTVSLLLMTFIRGSLIYRMRATPSSLSKPIRNLLSLPCSPYKNENDFLLARQMVNSFLGIGDKKFVSFSSLQDKLVLFDLGADTFEQLYGSIVKIEPKNYEDYAKRQSEVCVV